MNKVFSESYAETYDLVYRAKDYASECAIIEQLAGKYLATPARNILDLGCGTAGHLLHFSQQGLEAWGVDQSQSMLGRAQQKAKQLDCELNLSQANLTKLDLLKTDFSLCTCMFAVLGYLVENRDLAAALAATRKHLVSGGLFIFDFWYGPAVVRQRPENRSQEFSEGERRLKRSVKPELDSFAQLVRNHYSLQVYQGNELLEESSEIHTMRYFFPQEICYFLQQAGFEVVHFSGFPEITVEPTEEHWNSIVVARAV